MLYMIRAGLLLTINFDFENVQKLKIRYERNSASYLMDIDLAKCRLFATVHGHLDRSWNMLERLFHPSNAGDLYVCTLKEEIQEV